MPLNVTSILNSQSEFEDKSKNIIQEAMANTKQTLCLTISDNKKNYEISKIHKNKQLLKIQGKVDSSISYVLSDYSIDIGENSEEQLFLKIDINEISLYIKNEKDFYVCICNHEIEESSCIPIHAIINSDNNSLTIVYTLSQKGSKNNSFTQSDVVESSGALKAIEYTLDKKIMKIVDLNNFSFFKRHWTSVISNEKGFPVILVVTKLGEVTSRSIKKPTTFKELDLYVGNAATFENDEAANILIISVLDLEIGKTTVLNDYNLLKTSKLCIENASIIEMPDSNFPLTIALPLIKDKEKTC